MMRCVCSRLALGVSAALLVQTLLPDGAEARGASHRALRAQREEARALYIEGNRKYDVRQFGEALILFTRAFETVELPGFLFNIGQCHRMLGQCERALFFYRGYLRRDPGARNRNLVLRLVGECEEKIAAIQRQREKERLRQEDERLQRRRHEEPRRVLVVKEAIATEVAQARPEAFTPLPPPAARPLVKRWWLWTVVGLGAAALATGLGVGLSSRVERVLPSGSLGVYDPWGVR